MIYLNLELTDLCNLRCIMCGQAQSDNVHDRSAHHMQEDTWTQLLEGLAGVPDEISLCPHWLGDPTVHPRFAAMVREAFRRNRDNRLFRHFKLHTNGALLDRRDGIATLLDCAGRADQEADTFQFVHLSLDALSPEVFRRVKGRDQAHRVYANAIELLRERERRQLRWPRVTVAFVVMPENRAEAAPFLDYWRGVFERLGSDYQVTWDWPVEARDTIYLRRLNQRDQAAASRLHQRVLNELGLLSGEGRGATMPRSF